MFPGKGDDFPNKDKNKENKLIWAFDKAIALAGTERVCGSIWPTGHHAGGPAPLRQHQLALPHYGSGEHERAGPGGHHHAPQ